MHKSKEKIDQIFSLAGFLESLSRKQPRQYLQFNRGIFSFTSSQKMIQKRCFSGFLYPRGAVIPINGTSVLMVILQEKQKTNSGWNQASYDNKTITKNVQNCVAHLLVASKDQICAFQHQKINKNCILCHSSIYILFVALMNHKLNFGISVTF